MNGNEKKEDKNRKGGKKDEENEKDKNKKWEKKTAEIKKIYIFARYNVALIRFCIDLFIYSM